MGTVGSDSATGPERIKHENDKQIDLDRPLDSMKASLYEIHTQKTYLDVPL